MKNRNKYIAVIFMIFILFLPAATIVNGFISGMDEDSSNERDVLENNGALRDDDTEETDVQEDASVEADKAAGFVAMQHGLGNFIDGMFLRKSLIKLNERLTMFMTGDSYISSTQILLGKNQWIFYKSEADGDPLRDYMGINHYINNDLIQIALNLTETRDYLKERGVDFYILTVPNKEIVYAEYMPDTIVRVDEVSRGEQVANYIREKTDLVFVYPKQAFFDAKEKHQIFYTTDTHCNQKGAFVELQEVFREAYGTYADLDSVGFDINSDVYAGDLAVIGGVTDKYSIDTVYTFDESTADPSQYRDETVIVVGDSFGGFLSVVAKGYYKEVHWIDTSQFTLDMVDEYDADVIVWETVERRMDVLRDVNLLAQ